MSVEAPESLTSPRKRPLPADERDVEMTTPRKHTDPLESSNLSTISSLTGLSSHASTPPTSSTALRQASEAPSTSTSVSGEVADAATTARDPGSAPPAKRRKLTFEEKEQRRIEKEQKQVEKEARDKERAEQKAEREEEKRIKDEERRVKNEEKEAKNREKELEKQRKEEERLKKERSQPKLNTFFQKISPAKGAPVSTLSKDPLDQISVTAEPRKEGVEKHLQSLTPPKQILSDYRRTFLEFQPPSHTVLAPITTTHSESTSKIGSSDGLDKMLALGSDEAIDLDVASIQSRLSAYSSNSEDRVLVPVKEIIAQIQGTSLHPIDLTTTQDLTLIQNPTELLKAISVKHLHFHEDVRPPYHGTYTQVTSPRKLRKIARNPFRRLRHDTDYDYESEAEWEEPEEGEDLESEGEDDTESLDGPDDMEGFLDDEDTSDLAKSKRRLISGDLAPLSTGLCWVDQDGKLTRPQRDEHSVDFREYRMGLLIDTAHEPINPFSTAYWDETPVPTISMDNMPITDTAMQPPRLPLQARGSSSVNVSSSNPTKKAAANPTPKRFLEGDELAEFKSVVQGSTLKKQQLIDALKLKFPKTALAVLRDTLNEHAARVGAREADKRWVAV